MLIHNNAILCVPLLLLTVTAHPNILKKAFSPFVYNLKNACNHTLTFKKFLSRKGGFNVARHNSTRESIRYWDFMSYENAQKSEMGLNASHFTMRYSKTYKLVQAHWCILFLLGGIAFQITSLFHDLFPIAVFCYIGATFFWNRHPLSPLLVPLRL